MKKPFDAVAIGVIVFGVIAVIALYFIGNNNMPVALGAPAAVTTTPITKPEISVTTGEGAGTGSTGMSGGSPMRKGGEGRGTSAL